MTEGIELEALRMYLGSGVSFLRASAEGEKLCEILRKLTKGAIVTEPAKCKHSTPWRKSLHLVDGHSMPASSLGNCLGSTVGIEREVQFRGASDISGFGGLGVCSGITQPVAACANVPYRTCPSPADPPEAGPSFSKINLTSKTYNGEWAFVGESVQQPGQFALSEFRHLALREYHPLLAEVVRAARMIWKKDPSQWPCYRITFANNQQRSVLCERGRFKRRDAKKRDDSEALGVVIHLPTATAAIHENPDLGGQMPASDSQTS